MAANCDVCVRDMHASATSTRPTQFDSQHVKVSRRRLLLFFFGTMKNAHCVSIRTEVVWTSFHRIRIHIHLHIRIRHLSHTHPPLSQRISSAADARAVCVIDLSVALSMSCRVRIPHSPYSDAQQYVHASLSSIAGRPRVAASSPCPGTISARTHSPASPALPPELSRWDSTTALLSRS